MLILGVAWHSGRGGKFLGDEVTLHIGDAAIREDPNVETDSEHPDSRLPGSGGAIEAMAGGVKDEFTFWCSALPRSCPPSPQHVGPRGTEPG